MQETTQKTQARSLGQEDPREEELATESSIPAWEIHGQRSLTGYNPWSCKELDMTEQLIFSLSHTLTCNSASGHQYLHEDNEIP